MTHVKWKAPLTGPASNGAKKAYYLTTTLPYVNAEPHIGFALEIVQADVSVRYHKLLGDEVFFNTGTDEHGLKIYRKALEEGKDAQKYTDEYAEKFKALKEKLNLYPDLHFIRTTDSHHKRAAQEFWKRCAANGDIEKKFYKTKYCIGCELEKQIPSSGRSMRYPPQSKNRIYRRGKLFFPIFKIPREIASNV